MTKEFFTITRRPSWSHLAEIKVEITCDPFVPHSVKLGLG